MTTPSTAIRSAARKISAAASMSLLASVGLLACGDDGSETGSGGAGGAATSSTVTGTTSTGSAASGSNASGTGGGPDASSSSTGDGAGGEGGGAGGAGGAGGGAGGDGGAGGSIEPLVPVFHLVDLAMPIDMRSDGRIVLFQDPSTLEADVYFYDVAADELTYATSMGDALADFATGMSDDGVISGLYDVPVQAGVWTEADDWFEIESPFDEGCDINEGGAWDVSRDGDVVTGFLWNVCSPQSFLFRRGDEELVLLDVLGEPFDGEDRPPVNRATVISDDGTVTAGFAENGLLDRSAAVWLADGSGFLLDEEGQDAPSEVLSISTDGTVLGGAYGLDGFRWSEDAGLEILPRLETSLPNEPVFVNAIARDGDLLLGGSGTTFTGVPVAIVWSEEGGTRPLQEVVDAAGIDYPEGFLFGNVVAASADGSVLAGTGFDADFMTRGFVVVLPDGAYDVE